MANSKLDKLASKVIDADKLHDSMVDDSAQVWHKPLINDNRIDE